MERVVMFLGLIIGVLSSSRTEGGLIIPSQLKMFVDVLPDTPRIKGFHVVNGVSKSKSLKIGMFNKHWKFHRDLPPTPVFAYGTSKNRATVPGPTIESLHSIVTYVKWKNYLHSKHILPLDRTFPTAIQAVRKGIPTVVHLHGGIHEPESDGNSNSWFTGGFKERGPTWSKKRYHYRNMQQPGNL